MGVWNEEMLTVTWMAVKVSFKDAYRKRRIYRRLAKTRGRGHLRRFTVFVRYEIEIRRTVFGGGVAGLSAKGSPL